MLARGSPGGILKSWVGNFEDVERVEKPSKKGLGFLALPCFIIRELPLQEGPKVGRQIKRQRDLGTAVYVIWSFAAR